MAECCGSERSGKFCSECGRELYERLGERVRSGLQIQVQHAQERLNHAANREDRCRIDAERMEILARECEIAWVERMMKLEAEYTATSKATGQKPAVEPAGNTV